MNTIHTSTHTSTRTTARTSNRRSRRLAATTLLAAGGLLFGAASGVAAADSPPAELDIIIAPAEQTCPKSGKVDVAGNHTSLQILAPADTLIAGYCVKAGSANQGDGPEHYIVDPAATQVTISHSSGKAISHYTLVLIDRPLTTPDPDEPADNPQDEPADEPADEVEPVVPEDEPEVFVNPPSEVPTSGTPAPGSNIRTLPSTGTPAPGHDIQTLPSTGVNSGVLALLASLLVAAGGVLTRTTRRIDA